MNVGKNVIQKKNFRNFFQRIGTKQNRQRCQKNSKFCKNEQKLANKNGYLSK